MPTYGPDSTTICTIPAVSCAQRVVVAFVAILVLVPGCGSASDQTESNSSSNSSASPPEVAIDPELVGEWQRFQQCQELVDALTAVGLESAVLESVAGDGWIPGVSNPAQIQDPTHPCVGAVGRNHSHFFTADGEFGSRDANGQQVDDDQYKIIGEGTMEIGAVTFHYTITDNDTIAFDPVIPDCAPTCFEAQWSVAVAYPGHTWTRVS